MMPVIPLTAMSKLGDGVGCSVIADWFFTCPQGDGETFVVRLVADSIWGARHGVETLAQLIAWDDAASSLVIVDGFVIRDAPAYPHRGLLVDSTRNYLPMAKLRDIIIDMAQNKLNVLHW